MNREMALNEVRQRRKSAAERYRPDKVELLLIAEAPPADPDRYFYFDNVRDHDSLYRYVVREVLGAEPERDNKPQLLEALRQAGVFLIDLKPDPVDGSPLRALVEDLVNRVAKLSPTRIVLIKATVWDAAYMSLASAGLPVSPERIPFPGSGQQRRFQEAFRRAMK